MKKKLNLLSVIIILIVSCIFSNVTSVSANVPISSTPKTISNPSAAHAFAKAMMYMVEKITITRNGTPLGNVFVTIDNQQGVTNGQGVVELDNIMSGNQMLTTEYNHEKRIQQVMVMGPLQVAYEKGQVIGSSSFIDVFLSQYVLFTSLAIFLVMVASGFAVLAYLHHKKSKADIVEETTNETKLKPGKLYIRKHHSLGLISILCLLSAFGIVLTIGSQKQIGKILAATNANLSTPQSVQVIKEDTSALVYWNNQFEDTYNANPQDALNKLTHGYVVYWGVYDSSTQSITNPVKKITEHPNVQLQPLTPGVTYAAQVAAVGYDGSESQLTPLTTFTTDSSRVDALRQQMTGFFDDMNLSAGFFDDKKWNNAYSGCIGMGMGGQFINAQSHGHNQAADGYCDRGQNSSRPRGIFDFTNRTGTITFDMDGAQNRDFWYLDLYPTSDGPIDLSGHANLDLTNDPNSDTPPANSIRFEQIGDNVHVFYFDKNGEEFGSTPTGKGCADQTGTSLVYCNPPAPLVKNYRRHWQITINQDSPTTIHTKVFVDGALVAESSNVPFSYTKVYMNWVLFVYNNGKENFPYTLLHWDNFGWDGPAQTVETHNYTDGIIGTSIPGSGPCVGGFPEASTGNPVTKTIKIPDTVQGATAARLMFTVQMPGCNSYGYSASDHITINGKSYPFNDPRKDSWNAAIEPTTNIGEQGTVTIPLSDLTNIKQGDNTVVFNLSGAGIINTHMEFDFPLGKAPAYTPQSTIYPNVSAAPSFPDIGPGAAIGSINGHVGSNGNWVGEMFTPPGGGSFTDPQNSGGNGTISNPISAVSGIVPVWLNVDGEAALNGTGTNPGITEYDITVDRQRVFAKSTANTVPTPHVVDKYNWDTTKLCNGVHELFIEAFNPNGTPSIPNYFQTEILDNGAYDPVFVKTNNAGQPTCQPLGMPPSELILTPVYPAGGNGAPPPPIATATPATMQMPTNTPAPSGTTPQPTTVTPPAATITTSPSAEGTLGLTNIAANQDSGDPNNMTGSKFTMGQNNQIVTSMSVYVGDIGSSPNNQYQMAIYTDNNSEPGTLVAKTQTGTLTAKSWNTLPLSATLTANTSYWLLYNANGNDSNLNNTYYSDVNTTQGVWSVQSFGSWPQTFSQANLGGWKFSIYASFGSGNTTPTSAVTATPTLTPIPTSTSPSASTPSFVQIGAATPQTSQTSVTVPYTQSQNSGDTNIVVVSFYKTAATISQVTDSNGNIYVLAAPLTKSATMSQAIYYAKNIKTAAAGSNRVKVAFSKAVQYPDIRIVEYRGLDSTNPFDKASSATGNSSMANSGNITTTKPVELLLGAGSTNGSFNAAGNGYTSRVITSPDADIVEDRIVTTAGTYNATATQNGDEVMQIAAFKAANQ